MSIQQLFVYIPIHYCLQRVIAEKMKRIIDSLFTLKACIHKLFLSMFIMAASKRKEIIYFGTASVF